MSEELYFIDCFKFKNTEMQTAPPARGNYSETVNQWLIYDNYVIYETAKELADEKENKKEQKESKVKRKGTVSVISSDLPFIERHVRFATVTF